MISKKSLPNIFTAIRLVLAVPVLITALIGEWEVGFWLLITALVTDFLDGWAANKFDAATPFGKEFDRYTDAFLAAFCGFGMAASGIISWLWAIPIAIIGLSFDLIEFKSKPEDKVVIVWNLMPVTALFVIWFLATWVYGSLAFGWSWLYVFFTILVLLILAFFKRHRIKVWSTKH